LNNGISSTFVRNHDSKLHTAGVGRFLFIGRHLVKRQMYLLTAVTRAPFLFNF